jgi:hypothetical protein
MKIARNNPTAANLRSWRVIIMRSSGEYLGSVEAPDRERAEAEAIKLFELDQDQRSRLLEARATLIWRDYRRCGHERIEQFCSDVASSRGLTLSR